VTVNGVEYEEPPTVDDGALVTRSDIQSTVAGIAEKLPQPLKGLLLAAVKVAPVPVRAVATPWTPKVTKCIFVYNEKEVVVRAAAGCGEGGACACARSCNPLDIQGTCVMFL
jgi:hypothetical protein